MGKIALHWKIMIGLVLGIIWSFLSVNFGWNDFTVDWIKPFGDIFIRLLKMIAVPLVMFSIMAGIISLGDTSKLGRLGAKTLVAYLLTTFFAVGMGLALVNVIQPGSRADLDQRQRNRIDYELWVESQSDVEYKDDIRLLDDPAMEGIIAEVAAERAVMTADEKKAAEKEAAASANKNAGPLQPLVDMVPDNIILALGNTKLMLQVIFFSIFFAISLLFIPVERAAPVKAFIEGVSDIFLRMVDLVMQAAPFLVFALMAGVLAGMADTMEGLIAIFKGLTLYALTLLLGLGLMVFVVYPLIIATRVKEIGYMGFLKAIAPAQLLAFSSSSSAATLPVTMDCVRENVGVSKEITSFVLPIGATVNMDGTSMYQAVAVVFLAQFHMVDLTIVDQLTIVLTATLASIGSAAVPSAGLIMMILVLGSVGLPAEWIALILAIDRPLDMCRTVVNVTGDATVSTLIAKSENELNYQPQTQFDNFDPGPQQSK